MATALEAYRTAKQRARSVPDLEQFVTFEDNRWSDEGGRGSRKAMRR